MSNSPSPYQPLVPQPIWNVAVEHIRELIETGQIPEGTRLPAERELCAQLGISRISLRESLRVLQSMGYVETRPGSGTYARLPEPVERNRLSDWLEEDIQIIELFEVRLVVEPGVAALAAKRRDAEQLEALAETIETMRHGTEANHLEVVAADALFHRLIASSASNNALDRLVEEMNNASGTERRASLHVPGQVGRAIHDHQKIFDAIVDGDAEEARHQMQIHLERAVEEIGAFTKSQTILPENNNERNHNDTN